MKLAPQHGTVCLNTSKSFTAAKAFDYLASGVPLAKNAESSIAEQVRRRGWALADLRDTARWLSPEYAAETEQFGRQLTAELSLSRLGTQWDELLSAVRARRTRPERPRIPVQNYAPSPRPNRVALVNLLFNWPSTGGGTVHTAEAARFLSRAGYNVRHFSIQYDRWGLGQVRELPDCIVTPHCNSYATSRDALALLEALRDH